MLARGTAVSPLGAEGKRGRKTGIALVGNTHIAEVVGAEKAVHAAAAAGAHYHRAAHAPVLNCCARTGIRDG